MPPTAPHSKTPRPQPAQPVQDEWGMFDPQQAGIQATIRTLSREQQSAATPAMPAPAEETTTPAAETPLNSDALYTLEFPLRCPQCQRQIRTFRAIRVLRTQVAFMSTLPRKGYVLVCPECSGMLSAELSGLV